MQREGGKGGKGGGGGKLLVIPDYKITHYELSQFFPDMVET